MQKVDAQPGLIVNFKDGVLTCERPGMPSHSHHGMHSFGEGKHVCVCCVCGYPGDCTFSECIPWPFFFVHCYGYLMHNSATASVVL